MRPLVRTFSEHFSGSLTVYMNVFEVQRLLHLVTINSDWLTDIYNSSQHIHRIYVEI